MGARRSRTGAIAVALASVVLIAVLFPPAALATRGLITGFESDYYQSPDQATRNQWFSRTVDAGAGIVKLNLPWYAIAPTRPADPADPSSPAYDFSDIDAAVRGAAAHGLAVLLLVNNAPDWAEAPGRPSNVVPTAWKPNPADLANFARAIALRYSGNYPDPKAAGATLPAAEGIEIWNEPNTSGSIVPQYEGTTDVAAPLYREMLNDSYDAIKAVAPNMLVVAGGTDPYGARPGALYPREMNGAVFQLVPPVNFWEDVLCIRPVKTRSKKRQSYVRTGGCSGPVKFDVLAHHAIDNTGQGPLAHGPLRGDASTPDLGRVTSVLRGAESAGTTLPGSHQVWETEFWWDSNPPNPSGAKLATQARWIEQSLYLFWKGGASTAINFVVGDTDQRPNVRAGYQGGVYFADGTPKPSLTAFQFPFVTERLSKRRVRAWGKSPSAGPLLIQRRARGRWVRVRRIQVGQGAVFSTKLSLAGAQRLRAKVGDSTSLVWKQR